MPLYRCVSVYSTLCLGLLLGMAGCRKSTPANTPAPAPVISTSWFSAGSEGCTQWKDEYTGFSHVLYMEKSAPEITEDVLANSVILVYAKLGGYNPQVWPAEQVGLLHMELEYNYGSQKARDRWGSSAQAKVLRIQFSNSLDLFTAKDLSPDHIFRYVIIPRNGQRATGNAVEIKNGGIMAQYSESDLRTMSYSQLCKLTGLRP
ncbi:MAG: hypothetical protein JNL57_03725 [Bacteroidetes bacterium]|nr:hypothetical protein [Bacteroidota bacterium]